MSNDHSHNSGTGTDTSTSNDYTFPKPRYDVEIVQPIEMPKFKDVGDERIKLACYEYAETLWFSEKGFVKKMIMKSKTNSFALHYTLESFEENKEQINRTRPYRNEKIDDPKNETQHSSSSVRIEMPKDFEDGVDSIEIPRSRKVKVCSECAGHGVQLCPDCKGSQCDNCNRTGRSSAKCNKCEGQRKLLHYDELVITRKRHIDDFVCTVTSLPLHLIKEAPGTLLFNEEKPMISPLSHCQDQSVNNASYQFVFKHRTYSKKFLMQRQTLRAVPVTLVNYTAKGVAGEFFVYGSDNKVYFKNYPRRYCFIM